MCGLGCSSGTDFTPQLRQAVHDALVGIPHPSFVLLKKKTNKKKLDRCPGLSVKFVGIKQDKDWCPGQQDQPVSGDTQRQL